ncbi:MAG TPA: HAD family hydrolase [Candidatus Hydrothermia bacterium]|nr:HAD family hydrolase [Candidatus Hydrothermia bacterium]HOK22444.1 HAD family hydrolase [Candidatus Hydrothermia bacterium]HOL23151.1 HAD family hydrolase [Candidatus Hydrothermia bacterium]HPO78161.1 HAD family hydrolase [Candidatus Hydrothermia bacterium]HRD23072.1 HAD family hydrolase [Candidatus Hydrothermia bacterium]
MLLLLFDIDGTLINSGGAGAAALNRAFKSRYNVDDAMAAVDPHGQTDMVIVEEIFLKKLKKTPSTEEIKEILDLYVGYLREEVNRAERYVVLPYVRETLDFLLKENEFVLGLATGNVEEGARIKLERGDLNKYFPFGGFGSDSRVRSEIVRKAVERGGNYSKKKPDEVYVIGDTPLDIEAGKKASCRTIGIATSIYSVEELKKCKPDYTISNMGELLRIFS